jgi:hypothetical protein
MKSLPTVTAWTLAGRRLAVPQELAGDFHLIATLAGADADAHLSTWHSLARRLVTSLPGLNFYRVVFFGRRSAPARWLLRRRARRKATSPRLRTSTLLVFEPAPHEAAGLCAVNVAGAVIWEAEGQWTAAKERELLAVLGLVRDSRYSTTLE